LLLFLLFVVVKRRAWSAIPAKLHAPKLFALGVEREETEKTEEPIAGVTAKERRDRKEERKQADPDMAYGRWQIHMA
jgi:hypothetical protein